MAAAARAEEEEPLLPRSAGFVSTSRSKTVNDEDALDHSRNEIYIPTAAKMCLMAMIVAFGYCVYLMTSWFFFASRHRTLLPVCSAYWASWKVHGWWLAMSCSGSIFALWTFPLFCSLALLMQSYRDLLHERLYYEFLSRQLHIDFPNIPFSNEWSVRMLVVWVALGILTYPLAGLISLHGALRMVPFWVPILSFVLVYYMQWDLETRLVSVAKFVERDARWAVNHLDQAFFMKERFVIAASKHVNSTLKGDVVLTMSEYIKMIAAEAVRMHEAGEAPPQPRRSVFHTWSPYYWASHILHSSNVKDQHVINFRRWCLVYWIFLILMKLLFVFFLAMTSVAHLHWQGVLGDSWMTRWLNTEWTRERWAAEVEGAAEVSGAIR